MEAANRHRALGHGGSVATSGDAVVEMQLVDNVEPHVEDGRWLREYLELGAPHGAPIMLSIGESWEGPPERLRAALAEAPSQAHGYQLSPYGLPHLRAALADYLARTYRLPADHADRLRVAVSWSGTRNAMFDFARLVMRNRRPSGPPIAVAAAPSWDYAGILEPLGFEMCFLPLRPEDGLVPDRRAIFDRLMDLDRGPDLVVVNAQHNPTGVDWGAALTEELLRFAIDRKAAIIIDDAHYWLHVPGSEPTSAVEIISRVVFDERLQPVPWLAVRSLGKEFSCNGWGLGALVGEPDLIDSLVRDVMPEHQYNLGGVQQWAMAEWLESGDVWPYLDRRREEYGVRRDAAVRGIIERLGYAAESVCAGSAGPFLLFAVPPAFSVVPDGVRHFRRCVFQKTGVMLSDAWPLARSARHQGSIPFVRMYFGHDEVVLHEAFDRLARAGISWRMAFESVDDAAANATR